MEEGERTSPSTVAIASESAVMRVYLWKCLIKVRVICLYLNSGLDESVVYLGFIDVDWVRICVFSDQCAR